MKKNKNMKYLLFFIPFKNVIFLLLKGLANAFLY
jgi:hypothetical protein